MKPDPHHDSFVRSLDGPVRSCKHMVPVHVLARFSSSGRRERAGALLFPEDQQRVQSETLVAVQSGIVELPPETRANNKLQLGQPGIVSIGSRTRGQRSVSRSCHRCLMARDRPRVGTPRTSSASSTAASLSWKYHPGIRKLCDPLFWAASQAIRTGREILPTRDTAGLSADPTDPSRAVPATVFHSTTAPPCDTPVATASNVTRSPRGKSGCFSTAS
eukprot:392379-Rhodomonas_salina.1